MFKYCIEGYFNDLNFNTIKWTNEFRNAERVTINFNNFNLFKNVNRNENVKYRLYFTLNVDIENFIITSESSTPYYKKYYKLPLIITIDKIETI